jgi:hypothetical protein
MCSGWRRNAEPFPLSDLLTLVKENVSQANALPRRARP